MPITSASGHTTLEDLWVQIGNEIYDLSKFAKRHPGGKKILLKYAGTNATAYFDSFHPRSYLRKFAGAGVKHVGHASVDGDEKHAVIIAPSKVPFGDPSWYYIKKSELPRKSPYYTASHREWQQKCRAYVSTKITPFVDEWEEAGGIPRELHEQCYADGMYAPFFPVEYGGQPPDPSFNAQGWDYFHDLIAMEEYARCGSGGLTTTLCGSMGIALPPVLLSGSDVVKEKCVRDVITGKKIMALCISEPSAGSDVANLKTVAVPDPVDDKYYRVSGTKKFISGGCRADWLTVAVRTGGPGMHGITLLLVDAKTQGVKVTRQKTQGWLMSNTALIAFDDVRVPKENIIGVENAGFLSIMYNFNHERFSLAAGANRFARLCLEHSIMHARQRKTFGKRLIDHQVIRHKIAEMARAVEATQVWLESMADAMNKNGSHSIKLGANMALLKVQATRTMDFCAREASQVFGGMSYMREGRGRIVERIYRETRVNAIGGGSEEIMLDLAARLAKL